MVFPAPKHCPHFAPRLISISGLWLLSFPSPEWGIYQDNVEQLECTLKQSDISLGATLQHPACRTGSSAGLGAGTLLGSEHRLGPSTSAVRRTNHRANVPLVPTDIVGGLEPVALRQHNAVLTDEACLVYAVAVLNDFQ